MRSFPLPFRPTRALRSGFLAASATMLAAPLASAQWTVVHLNPAVVPGSVTWGADAGQQAGWATLASADHASLWSGTASSWIDLNPAGASDSLCRDVSAGAQVGRATFGGFNHAGLWTGSAASWVDLHPSGVDASEAWGAGGGKQVGMSLIAGTEHASLWSGTAASWIDLAPAGAVQSLAFGTDGTQQVGRAFFNGYYRASLWTGSAASWIDLDPPNSLGSTAFDVDNNHQVGQYVDGAYGGHACMWNGTASSIVDLSPAGTWDSIVYAIDGNDQVGAAWLSGEFLDRASLWSGTAGSWVDLHAFVPSNFVTSVARDVWHSGGVTYVAGYAQDYNTGLRKALLWVQTCAPAETYCTAKTNSQGCVPAMSASGSASLASSTLVVGASNVLNNKSGLLFWGYASNSAAFQGGVLCVQPPTIRTATQSSAGNPSGTDCSGAYSFAWSSNYLGAAGLSVGTDVFCQFWSRDPSSASTTGLTNGVRFRVCP